MWVKTIWVKFRKASKRKVAKAAEIAGYQVTHSGKCSDGTHVYVVEAATGNQNFQTLKNMMVLAGAFSASWS